PSYWPPIPDPDNEEERDLIISELGIEFDQFNILSPTWSPSSEEEYLYYRPLMPGLFVKEYERTGNVTYLWDAYRDARANGLPIPEAFFEYLSRCANRLRQAQGRRFKDVDHVVSVILEFRPRGKKKTGRGSSVFMTRTKPLDMAFHAFVVEKLIEEEGPRKQWRAFERAACLFNSKKETVKRQYLD